MAGPDWVAPLRSPRTRWNLLAGAVAALAVVLSPEDLRHITVFALVAGVAFIVLNSMRRPRYPEIPTAPTVAVDAFVPPATLPTPGLMLGRSKETDAARRHLLFGQSDNDTHPRLVVISGPAGIGKTALATHVARSVSSDFPDGTLFAELSRDQSDHDVLTTFVIALQPAGGVAPPDLGSLRSLYQNLTARRRILVVLDGVSDADAARTLLPGGRQCAAVLTSRRPVQNLGPQLVIPLSKLDEEASLDVLQHIVGADRVERSRPAAATIARVAAGHPLALQVTATTLAHRPNLPLQAVADRVDTSAGLDHDFARVLDLTYTLLTDLERSAVALLGLLPTQTFAPWMLAALMDEKNEVAWKVCERLVHARLLERVADDSSGVAKFSVLDHVWEITRNTPVIDQPEPDARLARLTAAAEARSERLPRDILRDTVYDALDRGDLSRALGHARGALARARELQPEAGTGAAEQNGLALAAVAEVLVEVGGFEDVNDLVSLALRTGSDLARPRALRCLGKLQRRQQRLTAARDTMLSALDAAAAVADGPEQIRVLRELAVVYASMKNIDDALLTIDKAITFACDDEQAKTALQPSLRWAKGIVLAASGTPERLVLADECLCEGAALAVAAEPQQQLWLGWILFERARVAVRSGRLPHARVLALDASSHFASMRHRYATARCRLLIGQSYLDGGSIERSLPFLEESLQTFASCGDRWGEGVTANAFANALQRLGRPDEAASVLRRAIAIFAALGDKTNSATAVLTLGSLDIPFLLASRPSDQITVPSQVMMPTSDQDRR